MHRQKQEKNELLVMFCHAHNGPYAGSDVTLQGESLQLAVEGLDDSSPQSNIQGLSLSTHAQHLVALVGLGETQAARQVVGAAQRVQSNA